MATPDRSTYYIVLDGFHIECETIEDSFEKSIVQHEYPYRNGAALEDMGQKARKLKIRCFFLNDLYDSHFDFLDHLEKIGLYTLAHPVYGFLKGCIESVIVRHDDREQTAEVDLAFIEDMGDLPDPTIRVDVVGASEAEYLAGLGQLQEALTSSIRKLAGTGSQIATMPLPWDATILSGMKPKTVSEFNMVQYAAALEAQVNATASAVTNPSNSALATATFSGTLPGRLAKCFAQAAERIAWPLAQLSSARSAISGMRTAFTDFILSLASYPGELVYTARFACAQRLALEGALQFASDELTRTRYRKRETGASFDARGNYQGAAPLPAVMTVAEIEDSLADIRTLLQAAVNDNREADTLKAQARVLLEHANQIKVEREKIVAVELDNSMPLHLVCLRNGLPYNYADRLLSINSIKATNFTAGTVNIYAR